MSVVVVGTGEGHRLSGEGPITELANSYLSHLRTRGFSAGTVRGYAFDLLNFNRFLEDRAIDPSCVAPSDLFDWLEWQSKPSSVQSGGNVVNLAGKRGAAPATMNRRVAAVRGLFEYAVITGARTSNPVPPGRRSTGLRARPHGMLGHLGTRKPRTDGRLVKQDQRLPENIEPADVATFIADLATYRDRAMALVMVLGGLRAAEVRSLKLADVDMGLRRLKVTGKGGRQRVVPVDRAFFTELAGYLHSERPAGLATPECFVVLRGPTRGQPMTEAGMRKIFRVHRARSGATRVRPHRLRHTYGTELAAAGIDLLVLKDLMGHAHPETTALYVHLSPEVLSAEYARARELSR
ncbi:site-specific tyrosine recombinase XerD [soil metagenome]